MTPEQVRLVKTSWRQLGPISGAAGQMFYDRLFTLDPALRPLFEADMDAQGRKLMEMIDTAVNHLDRLEVLVPALENLGRRHADYGVKDTHYDTVGAALLWTLERGLSEDFTAEVRGAWSTVYTVLAKTMKDAGAQTTV